MASAASVLPSAREQYDSSGNARFNAEAQSWDARPFVHEASKEASKAILARLEALGAPSKNLQVLEIGCGTGILSFLIAPHVKRVVAVDAAEGMIEVLGQKLQRPDAPKNIVPVAVLLEDPEDAALPPAEDAKRSGSRQKFDLITSHLVLHHIPDLRSVLKTMHGCLGPGGRVMLTDFQDFGPEAKRFHPASKLQGVQRHGIHAEEMENLMREVGFDKVRVSPDWTMKKQVERYDGEFEAGKLPDAKAGQVMDFPFVLCYGEKRS